MTALILTTQSTLTLIMILLMHLNPLYHPLSSPITPMSCSVSFVNSRSMTPTILPGDLILVEKISPALRRDVLHVSPAVPGTHTHTPYQ